MVLFARTVMVLLFRGLDGVAWYAGWVFPGRFSVNRIVSRRIGYVLPSLDLLVLMPHLPAANT